MNAYKNYYITILLNYFTRVLIFRAVAGPRNSPKHAKFARNLIKYMSIQHIWNVSRLLGLFNCRKLANLSWNFVTAMSNQRLKTTRRDYVAKNWALVMMLKDARQSAQIRSISSKICPENSPEISLIIFLGQSLPQKSPWNFREIGRFFPEYVSENPAKFDFFPQPIRSPDFNSKWYTVNYIYWNY